MISNEEIDKFISDTEAQMKEIDARFEETKAQIAETAKTVGAISDQERQAARELMEKLEREHEIESVNQRYAMEQQQMSNKASSTAHHSRRRNMI